MSIATPFIAWDGPRKLKTKEIEQISELVRNPQLKNPNPNPKC